MEGSEPKETRDDHAVSGAGRALLWLKRLVLAAVAALLLGFLPFEIYGEKGVRQYLRLKRELSEIRARNTRLRAQVEGLRREILELRDDRATLERVARDELGLIKEGEIVFVVRKQQWP